MSTVPASSHAFNQVLSNMSDAQLMTALEALRVSCDETANAFDIVQKCVAARGISNARANASQQPDNPHFEAVGVTVSCAVFEPGKCKSIVHLEKSADVQRHIDEAKLNNFQRPSIAATSGGAAAEPPEWQTEPSHREVHCFYCKAPMREYTRTLNSLCGACFTRWGSVAAATSSMARKACEARLSAQQNAEVATPPKREREMPRDKEAPGAPAKPLRTA